MATSLNLPAPTPFPNTPGEPPVLWDQWISSFKSYLLATGVDSQSPERKRAILAHCLGTKGQRVLEQLKDADILFVHTRSWMDEQ